MTMGSDRGFGLVFALFFGALFIWEARSGKFEYGYLAISALFFVISLTIPRVLHPLNVVWFRFGLLLHWIFSPIILALIFFVGIMPVGIVMRLLGKRPLQLRTDRDAKTYWILRTPPGPAPDSFKNQF